MKKQLSLNIPRPCSEKWTNFTKTQKGRFCGSCSKVVIDFTTMNDEEILNYFSNYEGHVCGRFRGEQLKSYLPANIPVRPGVGLLRAGVLSLLLLLTSKPVSAQNISPKSKTEIVIQRNSAEVKPPRDIHDHHLVKGIIKAEDDMPLPGASIVLKGSDIGTTSDANGYFEFPQQLKEGDVLLIAFIGYVPYEYKIPKHSPDVVEINLMLSIDFLGEVAVGEVYQDTPSGFNKFLQKIKQWF